MPDISIQAADGSGSFSAYCAMPKSGSSPGIVVLQEIFGVNQVMRDLCDGYCLGGSLAYATACFTDADACSGYYPVQIEDSLEMAATIKNTLTLHVAELDGFCPPEAQEEIATALGGNAHVTVHSYPGVDHAFARIGGNNFDINAALEANNRTADLFRKKLGS
jgi:dienelactone hydrolase